MTRLHNLYPPYTKIDDIPRETIALHVFAGEFESTWHSHQRDQMVYAEHGVLYVQTHEQRFILPAWHGAWLPAGMAHQLRSESSQLYLRSLYFLKSHDDQLAINKLSVFPISPMAREMILYTEQWRYDMPMSELERSFMKALRYLIRQWCNDPLLLVLPTCQHPTLQPLVTFILKNLAEPLTIDDIAGRAHLSSRTVMRLFQRELGMTFQQYLRTARIIRALDYLARPDTSVTDTMTACGYSSLSAFSRTFKEMVGVNPSEYRAD